MQVLCEIQIAINEKVREEEIIIDLSQSTDLEAFKRHLLSQAKLSPNQHDRYLLQLKTNDYITQTSEQKYSLFTALTTNEALKHQILSQLLRNRKLCFKLQKYTAAGSERSKRRRLIKDTKAKNVIEFDKEGQVVRDKLQVLQERPRYQIYPIEYDEEICAFCYKSSQEDDLRIKCGPVYGPIKIQHKQAFVHELCALWTPEIFLDDKNKFRNLGKAIKRCKKMVCSKCRKKGGGLGCFIKNCDKSYHYLCAKESNCLFVNSKFIIYCENHRSEATAECLEEEQIDEEQEQQLQHYICTVCKSGLDEQHILICEGCDLGFHSNCHHPIVNMESLDEDEEWYCHDCLNNGKHIDSSQ